MQKVLLHAVERLPGSQHVVDAVGEERYQRDAEQDEEDGVQVDGMDEVPHVGHLLAAVEQLQQGGKQRQEEHHVEGRPLGQTAHDVVDEHLLL